MKQYDPVTMEYIEEKNEEPPKTHNYQVTFHLMSGREITVECMYEPFDKPNFAENVCRCNYAILEGGNTCVNLRQVTWLEVKEI
jgi:hypothetical protein